MPAVAAIRNTTPITRSSSRLGKLAAAVVGGQGLYYTVTGVWPLISIESFQWVTGRKTDHLVTGNEGDHWLVMTVGALITVIGVTLLLAAWRGNRSLEITALAMLSAVALTAIDVIFVLRGAIPPIYLADAVAEIVLLLGWSIVLFTPFNLKGGS